MQDIRTSVVTKVFIKLMPILFLSYILAYLDRVNISFAALTMRSDLGLTAELFGFGAGIFFIGYFIFEIPSNLLLTRFGARRWISRIMISWGIVSVCMALVQGATSFVILRFLLGVAEAGFFPGIILYLTFWFPQEYRGRIISAFMLSIPISLAIGAPVSTALLKMEGILGLHGWQWLFIIEGVPTVLVGILFLMIMPDSPKDAKWLNQKEQAWLDETIQSEQRAIAEKHGSSIWAALKSPMLLLLSFIYLTNVAANIGLSSFLPQIIKEQGYSNMAVGWLTSIPYVVGIFGILLFGYLSDKYKAPRWILLIALLITGIGLIIGGFYSTTVIALAITAISFAGIGIYGTKAPFWALPSMFLTGAAAATGIAFINSVGNLGGFFGPTIVGMIRERTHSFSAGLYFLGGLSILAALLTLIIIQQHEKTVRRNEKTKVAMSTQS